MLNKQIKEIGEKELIKRISEYMPNNQTSDDCAFLKTNNDDLLINTDLMVENTHFNNKIISPRDLGWKAVTTNYSDLTSSGCLKTIGINIGLVLSPNTKLSWVTELYEGISEALKKYGGVILGGDFSKGENTIISVTALGIQSKLKMRRHACKPGEIIITTGCHGLSKLGFLLKSDLINDTKIKLSKKLEKQCIDSFCRPEPKRKVVQQILYTKNDNLIKEIGCTDSSDGFYQAIFDLAQESKCKAIIDYQKIPKINLLPKSSQWDQYYFFGGEDYELLFSLPRKWAERLLKINKNCKEIGYFATGKNSVEIKNCPDNLIQNNSYSHF